MGMRLRGVYLIKELSSDEFIEKKIKDILGDNNVDGKEEWLMAELLFDIFLFSSCIFNMKSFIFSSSLLKNLRDFY